MGSTGWATARFTAEKPIPKRIWEKWLDESYELMAAAPARKKASKKPAKKAAKKATRKAVKKRR